MVADWNTQALFSTSTEYKITKRIKYVSALLDTQNVVFLQETHGSYDCVLAEQMEADDMLAGFWFEEKTETLFIVINNIRVGKDIDLDYYGFNKNYID